MMNRWLLTCLAAFFWFGLTTPAMAAALPMPPFEARYTVFGKGLPIGESIMTLSDEGGGRYTMRSEVRPNGLAALLISGQISERASGEFRDGIIRPASYEQHRSSGNKSTVTRLSFDWQNRRLQAQSNAEQAALPLSVGVVDPLSLHLQVMWDLQQGRQPSQYTLVDDTELKTYQVRLEGEETLKTPLGELRTVRLSQSKPGSTRITTLWFAPALNYLTVQIAQQKKGQEELRMVIENIQGVDRP